MERGGGDPKLYYRHRERGEEVVGGAPDSGSTGCEFESRQERRETFLLQS